MKWSSTLSRIAQHAKKIIPKMLFCVSQLKIMKNNNTKYYWIHKTFTRSLDKSVYCSQE